MDSDFEVNRIKFSVMPASIDHVVIDTEKLTTVSGTTNVPQSVYERPQKERDLSASQLLIEKNKAMEEVEPEITNALHSLLRNPNESAQIRKGNLVVVMNSNIYGSAIGGDVQQANLTFIQEWNQVKNEVDIDRLRAEVEEAIILLQKNACKDEHYTDLANVTLARDELKKADGPSMLKYLRKTGEFGLDIIKGMGSTVLLQLLMGR